MEAKANIFNWTVDGVEGEFFTRIKNGFNKIYHRSENGLVPVGSVSAGSFRKPNPSAKAQIKQKIERYCEGLCHANK